MEIGEIFSHDARPNYNPIRKSEGIRGRDKVIYSPVAVTVARKSRMISTAIEFRVFRDRARAFRHEARNGKRRECDS